MKTRLAGITIATAIIAFPGCSSAPQNKKIALQIEPNQSQADTSPATQPAVAESDSSPTPGPVPALLPPASAGILARKTQSYAKSMEGAMARRNAVKPITQDDSISGLLDPEEFRIGPVDDGQTPTPSAQVVKKAAPETKPAIQASIAQANSGATVDIVKTTEASNTPVALPPEQSADKASAVLSPTVDSFESRITKRVKDYPRDLSANLDYQLLLFLRDEPVPQLSTITALPSEDRELISAVMDGLSNFKNILRSDNNMLLSRKIRPLTDLADRLKTQAELSIPTLVLCTKVDGFGRYDPIDPPRFPAQHDTPAIIYCELENFQSQQNQAKIWQTDVTQEAVLYTEDGMQVWADKTQQVQDMARNRRHDFFLRTVVNFPPTLTVGRYLLKVTIVDRQANRVAECSLPIQIVAQ